MRALWGILLLLLFGTLIALLIGVIIWALTRNGGNLRLPGSTENAREVLDRRYARGDITTEEYMEMRAELERR